MKHYVTESHVFKTSSQKATLNHLQTDRQTDWRSGEFTKQQKYECLVEKLFDPANYSPLVRPVSNISNTVDVDFSVQLSQIVNLDEKNQIMKTNVWLQLYWTDFQLKWEDDDVYNEIEAIRINPEYAWRPDVVLFNNADGNYEVSFMSNVVIYKSGYVNWIPPAIYKSSCLIDVEYFPFDEQVCDLKFGSWTFTEEQLQFAFFLDVTHFDVSDYLENGAWDIVSGEADIVRVPVGNKYKPMVTFQLKLRRKTLFYTVNLIIPCVLISFVTVSVFILPADAGEKITLCISILLALVVFLLLISKILPPSLTIPLISQFLLFTFIMNILAIISTVIVINRNYRTPRTHQMPRWMRVFLLNWLPRLLFMKRPDHDKRWRGKKDNKKDPKGHPDLTHSTTIHSVPNTQISGIAQSIGGSRLESMIETHHPNCRLTDRRVPDTAETSFTENVPVDAPNIQFSPEIFKAAESISFIQKHQKKDDEYHTVIDDWRYIARVVDRLLLTIFFIVTFTGTLGIFFKAPHIFEKINQDEILARYNANWDRAKQPPT
ncbi:ACH3-like protein [Mya arenaria]|uniref:ACH3-like protein n=1 Tax=Mya arenaria TaxID=6604 RepID=A0ABY7DN32_MYAAR|nr:ACH3-like protein [Mya arenaria]